MAAKISEMRARRYPLTEAQKPNEEMKLGKLHADHSAVMPNPQWFPTMSPYGHMRAMVLAASLPDEPSIANSSPVADHPFSAGYSEWDQKIINRAAQLCGFSPRKMGDKTSVEPEHIHRHSPVNHNSGRRIKK